MILGNIDVLLPIFFILSGFALYYQLGGAVLQGKPLPASRTWLFRRALRLLPVYYLVFILVWVWRYGGSTMQWQDLAWGGLLMQTWSTDHIFRTIDPGWYLSVEWHFALVVAIAVLPWMRTIASWPMRSRIVGLLVPPLVLAAITLWWRLTLRDARVPATSGAPGLRRHRGRSCTAWACCSGSPSCCARCTGGSSRSRPRS